MNDTLQSLIRAILKIGAGLLVSKGWADQSTAEIVAAGVAAAIGIIWGVLHRTQSKPTPEPVTPPQQ